MSSMFKKQTLRSAVKSSSVSNNLSIELKNTLLSLFDLNSLIHKDRVNKCTFVSACVGTTLFFLIHCNEASNDTFVGSLVSALALS